MKKMFAILAAIVMVFAVAAAALAEEAAEPTFIKGIKFNMDMDQVMEIIDLPNPEIDREKNRGTTEFYELEYENVAGEDGYTADIKFLFVGNSMIAIHCDMADGTDYAAVKAELVKAFGEAIPFNAANIGNAKYAIDDDGDLDDCKEMIEAKGVTIILEQDHDGDIDVTFLDPTAAYINN